MKLMAWSDSSKLTTPCTVSLAWCHASWPREEEKKNPTTPPYPPITYLPPSTNHPMYTYTADEKFLIALISVTTNFSVLPLAISCMRRGMVYESVIGACSAATSIMYRITYSSSYYTSILSFSSSFMHIPNLITIHYQSLYQSLAKPVLSILSSSPPFSPSLPPQPLLSPSPDIFSLMGSRCWRDLWDQLLLHPLWTPIQSVAQARQCLHNSMFLCTLFLFHGEQKVCWWRGDGEGRMWWGGRGEVVEWCWGVVWCSCWSVVRVGDIVSVVD